MSEETTDKKETARIEAFSDGVFAIAMTLLVLELKVPQLDEVASGTELWIALLSRWPSYLAYLVSFLFILIVWVNHHRLFVLIGRSNSRLLFLNGLILLVVTTIPFPTALLAEYLDRPAAWVACALYTATFVLLALSFSVLSSYISQNNHLLIRNLSPAQQAGITHNQRFSLISYSIAFALSFVNVYASFGLCILLAIYWAVIGYEQVSKADA